MTFHLLLHPETSPRHRSHLTRNYRCRNFITLLFPPPPKNSTYRTVFNPARAQSHITIIMQNATEFTFNRITGTVYTGRLPTIIYYIPGLPMYTHPVLYQVNRVPKKPHYESEYVFKTGIAQLIY